MPPRLQTRRWRQVLIRRTQGRGKRQLRPSTSERISLLTSTMVGPVPVCGLPKRPETMMRLVRHSMSTPTGTTLSLPSQHDRERSVHMTVGTIRNLSCGLLLRQRREARWDNLTELIFVLRRRRRPALTVKTGLVIRGMR
jgi:hypothetical protein